MGKNIFFLGCGKMGSIIAQNLISNNIFAKENFLILKPTQNNKINGLRYVSNVKEIPQNYIADIVFICIKPQNSKKILEEFCGLNSDSNSQSKIFNQNTIFISILAGKTTSFFKKFFGESAQIARCMPNVGIEVDQGIIPLFYHNISSQNGALILDFFKSCGTSFEIKDEKLFHALTSLYGCGPAYIFLLQEIFEKLAKKHQIPHEIIHDLTTKLLYGSSLFSLKSGANFDELRAKVTSKKGVTEASLKVLIKNNKLQNLFSKAIENGIKKSQRLEKL